MENLFPSDLIFTESIKNKTDKSTTWLHSTESKLGFVLAVKLCGFVFFSPMFLEEIEWRKGKMQNCFRFDGGNSKLQMCEHICVLGVLVNGGHSVYKWFKILAPFLM